MLTLYTAVGVCRLVPSPEGHFQPKVFLGGRELSLDPYEMLLWSSLSWNILTHQEARALFYEQEKELHMLSDLDFEHYLNRLIFRGLVAAGSDCTGIHALYNLVTPLYVRSSKVNIFSRVLGLAKMVLFHRCPVQAAVRIFRNEKLSPEEQQMLKKCQGKQNAISDLLRSTAESRTDHGAVAALTNLYLKRQVVFDSL